MQEPWQGELSSRGWTEELQRRIVEQGERPSLPRHTMPEEVANIIEATWKHCSQDRPSMQEVLDDLRQLSQDAARGQ